MTIDTEMTPGLRVHQIWAFVAQDASGDEGICGFVDPTTGFLMPMICADRARVDALRTLAKAIGRTTERKIVLRHFENWKDTEVIHDGQ